MNVVQYARVSSEPQDAEDKASIDQQLATMDDLCKRNEWQVIGVFIDKENYKATQNPKKGMRVNPSGERSDRPQFLAMLEAIKSGEADVVLCWRDDRLVRHPRVAVALEDALDIGDTQRKGTSRIEIKDATGAAIDRFTLSIKATIWREENKRRAERTKMGKIATLDEGRWPGAWRALGYTSVKEPGKRGRKIEIVEHEKEWVSTICEMFAAGRTLKDIRAWLIAEGVPQGKAQAGKRRHEWAYPVIYDIVKAEYYTGKLTFRFADDCSEYAIDIPPIISRELWKQNQARMRRNRRLSTRNAKGVYLLQNLVVCGECGWRMNTQARRRRRRNGRTVELRMPEYQYQCYSPLRFPDEPHARPYTRGGLGLDWAVWRHLVDFGIKRPDIIRVQVQQRQAELQMQGDSVDGDIAHARRRLAEITSERRVYQKQHAQGRATDEEFSANMIETEESYQYWESELVRLEELRDNAVKVQAGLDYATELLTTLQDELQEIDISPDELRVLSEEKRNGVLRARRTIIQALCDEVVVYADGRVKIVGVLDGSEGAQFNLTRS